MATARDAGGARDSPNNCVRRERASAGLHSIVFGRAAQQLGSELRRRDDRAIAAPASADQRSGTAKQAKRGQARPSMADRKMIDSSISSKSKPNPAVGASATHQETAGERADLLTAAATPSSSSRNDQSTTTSTAAYPRAARGWRLERNFAHQPSASSINSAAPGCVDSVRTVVSAVIGVKPTPIAHQRRSGKDQNGRDERRNGEQRSNRVKQASGAETGLLPSSSRKRSIAP